MEKPVKRSRRCLVCCSYFVAVAIAVAVTVVVLLKTVYKVRDPRMTIDSFAMGQLNLSSPNVSISTEASVENPNAVAVSFGVSTTSLFYRGGLVARADGPEGYTGAHGTFRTNVTFEVSADRLLADPAFLADVGAGALGMDTSTRVGGRVRFLGVFHHHVDVVMNCTVTVSVSNQTILDQHCVERVRL